MRVGPEQIATGQVSLGQVWVEHQGLFSSRERLLLQIPGLLGRDEGQPRDVGRGEVGVGTRETGIERDGVFEQRDRSLGVGVGRPDTEIPRAQYGVVRGGVDQGQCAETRLLWSVSPARTWPAIAAVTSR